MRPSRLFGMRWAPGEIRPARQAAEFAQTMESAGWRTLIGGRRGVLLMVKDEGRADIIVLPGELGAVVGPLFARSRGERLGDNDIDAKTALAWCESAGESLSGAHWGGYLAVLHDRRADVLHILRDPMGSSACFIAREGDLCVFFTHAGDVVRFKGGTLAYARAYLEVFLVSPRLVSARTAIEGVEEIPAGVRVSLGRARSEQTPFWRPSTPLVQYSLAEFEEAARGLRRIVETSAACWAARGSPILHRLSGGLDSTLTLAALTKAQTAKIVCVNEYPKDVPEGDERPMARQAAAKFSCDLVELAIGPADVDYARVLDIEPSAKPSLSELSFAGDTFAAYVRSENFALLTSGQGGDQVMHRNRGPEIGADAVRDGLALREAVKIALDTARLGRRPVWDVFAAQLRHGVLRQPFDHIGPLAPADPMAPAGAPERARALWSEQIWMEEARRASPARGKRMLRIADLQFYHNPSVLSEVLAQALVLTAQPIVEFCLSVPPYVMTQGGRERALARAAFADVLPEAVLHRSLKGDTTRHFTAVLEHNLDFLRAILIEGRLVEEAIVPRENLERPLRRSDIADGKTASGLMQCLAAELWLRRFEAANARAAQELKAAEMSAPR